MLLIRELMEMNDERFEMKIFGSLPPSMDLIFDIRSSVKDRTFLEAECIEFSEKISSRLSHSGISNVIVKKISFDIEECIAQCSEPDMDITSLYTGHDPAVIAKLKDRANAAKGYKPPVSLEDAVENNTDGAPPALGYLIILHFSKTQELNQSEIEHIGFEISRILSGANIDASMYYTSVDVRSI